MAGRGEQQRGGVMGEGRGERRGETERVTVEEAQGHPLLCRQKKKMREREMYGRKMGIL